MVSILRRKRKEKDLERELMELQERCSLLERKIEEAMEKTEKIEKGTKLLTEAVYKVITYLKDFEWPRERGGEGNGRRFSSVIKKSESVSEERFTEVEKKLLEEVERRGTLTVNECYAYVGKSREHVSRLLKRLMEKGVLSRERRGKTFYYRLAEKR